MIKLTSEMVLIAAEAIPGYKDPKVINYIAAFSCGVDTIRVYVEHDQYQELIFLPPFSPVTVEFEYSPMAKEARYAVRYLAATPRTIPAVATPLETEPTGVAKDALTAPEPTKAAKDALTAPEPTKAAKTA